MNNIGFKELYDVKIKSTYSMKIGETSYEPGETLCYFDTLTLANFEEVRSQTTANGGKGNPNLIYWDAPKEVYLQFSKGKFSPQQLALLSNHKLIESKDMEELISQREVCESNDKGIVTLKENPQNLFIYDLKEGKRQVQYELVGKEIHGLKPYLDYIIDYTFSYQAKESQTLQVGESLTQGYVSLEGRTRIKEDKSGINKTGIIKIPKLKIMSSLYMTLGSDAQPMVQNFRAVACPVGKQRDKKIMKIVFLDTYLEDRL